MIKTARCVFGLIAVISVTSSFAAPSIRRAGTSAPTSLNRAESGMARSSGILTNANKKNATGTQTIKTSQKSSSVSVSSKPTSASGRVPWFNTSKILKKAKDSMNPSGSDSGSGSSAGSGSSSGSGSASSEEIKRVENRLDEVEKAVDNMVTYTEDTGEGTYVTSVSIDGNALEIEKTNLLHAPVRNVDGSLTTSSAEIWVIK